MGLAVFAVIMSLIGAFYYLRLVKLMYFDAPTQTAPIEAGADVRSVLSVNGALVLVLGIVPGRADGLVRPGRGLAGRPLNGSV
jgi:NADH-quinone oxidoreductase subunit N